MTFYYKRVFPIVWFGFLAFFMAAPFIAPIVGGTTSGSPLGFLLFPAFMMIVGYYMMKKMLFDLADEVFDDGDALVIRNGHLQDRIALADITNVGYSQFARPPRVTLSLRNPSSFGDQVAFCAPVSFNPFKGSPIVDELIRRVDAARQNGRARRGS